ncbi:hypothetical protein [Caballeronia sp. GAWG1-5s-s]|uniref:hypothetical protein n=1 Tax=Caballeronia sp. GAWG1-5s-s TaxID=2921743 RepID=UPI0020280068|nr:hypothetical protein [Caballeronia sp. GAWG1-5s-s]
MHTLAEAFDTISDTPTRKRVLIASQGGTGNCRWLPASIGKHGELRFDVCEEEGVEIDDEAADAVRLFDAGSLSSCALVVHLGALGMGALVMGPGIAERRHAHARTIESACARPLRGELLGGTAAAATGQGLSFQAALIREILPFIERSAQTCDAYCAAPRRRA